MIRKDFAFIRSTPENRQKFNRETKIAVNTVILISKIISRLFIFT